MESSNYIDVGSSHSLFTREIADQFDNISLYETDGGHSPFELENLEALKVALVCV